MSLDTILAELKSERDRVHQAIIALEGVLGGVRTGRAAVPVTRRNRGRRKMTAAVRERLSQAKKAWWAKKKAPASKLQTAQRRTFSAATRRKMAKAQKARWAKMRQQPAAKG